MTRKEVIEFGNMWLQINEDCKDSSTYAFFQMAIKALEQEPTHMIDKSNFSQEQYKADLQCAYDCGKSILDKIIAEIGQEIIPRNSDQYDYEAMWQNMGLRMALKVIGKYKAYKGTEHWISAADHYICPVCGLIVVNPNHFIGRRCPQCGFQDKKDKEQEDGK